MHVRLIQEFILPKGVNAVCLFVAYAPLITSAGIGAIWPSNPMMDDGTPQNGLLIFHYCQWPVVKHLQWVMFYFHVFPQMMTIYKMHLSYWTSWKAITDKEGKAAAFPSCFRIIHRYFIASNMPYLLYRESSVDRSVAVISIYVQSYSIMSDLGKWPLINVLAGAFSHNHAQDVCFYRRG